MHINSFEFCYISATIYRHLIIAATFPFVNEHLLESEGNLYFLYI